MPKPTKQLRDGMIVTYKRGWIVPCGKGDVPRGVWRTAECVRMANGVVFNLPAGVQVGGDANVLSGHL